MLWLLAPFTLSRTPTPQQSHGSLIGSEPPEPLEPQMTLDEPQQLLGTAAASIPLGNAASPGMRMPAVGLGTGAYTHDTNSLKECWSCSTVAYNATRSWLEQGGRLIDAGECYRTQVEVGRAIADSGVARADLFISSKVGWCDGSELGYNEAIAQHKTNLKELGLDYIDLLLVHWPGVTNDRSTGSLDAACITTDPASCRRATWEAMLTLRDKGVDGGALAVGVSNFEESHLKDLDEVVGGNASRAPTVNQMEFSALFHDDELRRACDARGIVVQATAPLHTPDKNAVEHPEEPPLMARDPVRAAASHDATAAQVALRWVLQQNVGLVVRSKNATHQRDNLALSDVDLTASEIAAIGGLGDRSLKSYLPDPRDIP